MESFKTAMRLARTHLIGVAFVIAVAGQAAVAQTTELTAEQRRLNMSSFEFVWNTVNDDYWDPTFGGVDWQAVHNELRPKLDDASTMDETREVLRDMISRLGVSHFAIISADVYLEPNLPEDERSESGEIGIDYRVIDGRAIVTTVTPDSPAQRAGVKVGWEIELVRDVDIRDRLDRLLADAEGEPVRQVEQWIAVARGFRLLAGEMIDVTFRDEIDKPVCLTIPIRERSGNINRFGNLGETRVQFESREVAESIGYIRFSAFFDPPYVMGGYNKAMALFLDADGLIIDLRGNGGGMGAMAMGMLGWLVDESKPLGILRMRDSEFKMHIQARPTTYQGPVVVLVDGLSGSASEFFAMGLQETGRACIVGTRTAGAALPGEFETLPNGDVFLHATADLISAGGAHLEGVGVHPDIVVAPTRAGLIEGRDEALQAAINWLRQSESQPTKIKSNLQHATKEIQK